MKGRSITWIVCLILATALCTVWGQFPLLDSAPLARVGLFAALGFLSLCLCLFFPDTSRRRATILLVSAAMLLRLVLLSAPVSDDVHRYLWEGKLTLAGENPFAAIADDPTRAAYRDQHWAAMNHRENPTAYPPGIQWIMAATVAVAYHPLSVKALALFGDLLCIALLLKLLAKKAAPIRWAGFYAFNPITLMAFAAEAHFDSLMVAAILAMLLADQQRRPALAWLFLGLAIQVKVIALVLAPLLVTRRNLRGIWAILPILVIPTLPFLSEIDRWWEGVSRFAASGVFNGPIYTVFYLLDFQPQTTRMASIALFALVVAVVFIANLRGLPLMRSCGIVLAALLVCSPVVHFWYLSWLLPFAVTRPSFALSSLSITMGGYFIAWHTQDLHGWWGFGHGTAALIWALPLMAFFAQHRSSIPRIFRKYRAPTNPESMTSLSIVIPTLNAGPELHPIIENLRTSINAETEIIIADGGSTDASLAQIREKVITCEPGRGEQIAAGIAMTNGAWILIAHADTQPADGWHGRLQQAMQHHPRAAMLVLGQRFHPPSMPTLLIEALNELRVIFGGVAFGDQTMVIRRTALDACGGFPAQPLMEDVEVSTRLQAQGEIIYLGQEWKVSAKKWHRSFIRRFALIIRIMTQYQLVRLYSTKQAREFSKKLYAEYYPTPEKTKG